jgi:CrcB protein
VPDLFGLALILLGGFLGGMARFWVSGAVARAIGEAFPWGTLVVNVVGCFAIGALTAATMESGAFAGAGLFRDLVVIGFLGSFTTVSSFSLQTLNLALDGERARALGNILVSVGLCIAAVAAAFFGTAALLG